MMEMNKKMQDKMAEIKSKKTMMPSMMANKRRPMMEKAVMPKRRKMMKKRMMA